MPALPGFFPLDPTDAEMEEPCRMGCPCPAGYPDCDRAHPVYIPSPHSRRARPLPAAFKYLGTDRVGSGRRPAPDPLELLRISYIGCIDSVHYHWPGLGDAVAPVCAAKIGNCCNGRQPGRWVFLHATQIEQDHIKLYRIDKGY